MYACISIIYVPREVKIKRALGKMTKFSSPEFSVMMLGHNVLPSVLQTLVYFIRN